VPMIARSSRRDRRRRRRRLQAGDQRPGRCAPSPAEARRRAGPRRASPRSRRNR
jgi:hypothetical protein